VVIRAQFADKSPFGKKFSNRAESLNEKQSIEKHVENKKAIPLCRRWLLYRKE